MTLHHDTLVFERDFAAPPSALFAAYADPALREAWSTPSPTADVRIDESDFRAGGLERGRCGTKGDMRWTTDVAYLNFETDRRIIFTELLKEREQILTVALITFNLETNGSGGTRMTVTDRITFLVGPGAVDGHRQGYTQALDNLAGVVGRRVGAA